MMKILTLLLGIFFSLNASATNKGDNKFIENRKGTEKRPKTVKEKPEDILENTETRETMEIQEKQKREKVNLLEENLFENTKNNIITAGVVTGSLLCFCPDLENVLFSCFNVYSFIIFIRYCIALDAIEKHYGPQ